MRFFQDLAGLDFTGQMQLTILKTEGGLTVSVFINDPAAKDPAVKSIPPFVVSGSPADLDDGFFGAIQSPVAEVTGFVQSSNAFLAGLELAKKQSKEQADKNSGLKREQTEQEKKFTAAMAKSEELDVAGRPREAWSKLPKVTDFPLFKAKIEEKRKALEAKFMPAQGSLFGSAGPVATALPTATAGPQRAALVMDDDEPIYPDHDEETDRDGAEGEKLPRKRGFCQSGSLRRSGLNQPHKVILSHVSPTAMLAKTELPRVFEMKNNGAPVTLPDPNPALTPQQVMGFYAGTYPLLTTAKLSGPIVGGDKISYTFDSVLGTKG